jgi:hypothetical protein
MRNQKTTEAMKRRAREAKHNDRVPRTDSQIAEALRLCRGTADRETLLKLCPSLSIPGAIELGLLVERNAAKGLTAYTAGPRLADGNCDLTKAINLAALVGQVSRGK